MSSYQFTERKTPARPRAPRAPRGLSAEQRAVAGRVASRPRLIHTSSLSGGLPSAPMIVVGRLTARCGVCPFRFSLTMFQITLYSRLQVKRAARKKCMPAGHVEICAAMSTVAFVNIRTNVVTNVVTNVERMEASELPSEWLDSLSGQTCRESTLETRLEMLRRTPLLHTTVMHKVRVNVL